MRWPSPGPAREPVGRCHGEGGPRQHAENDQARRDVGHLRGGSLWEGLACTMGARDGYLRFALLAFCVFLQ
eukprot:12937947-Alexandrium_andersonii.AAC.1